MSDMPQPLSLFPPNARHKVLRIPELCETIASNLRNHDLFHLALTSRSLLDPALRALWYHITHIMDLLALLPTDVVSMNNGPGGFEVIESSVSQPVIAYTL